MSQFIADKISYVVDDKGSMTVMLPVSGAGA